MDEHTRMIVLLFLVFMAGCTTTTTLPTVTGGHVQDPMFGQAMTPGQRYLVWSPSQVLSQYVAGELLNQGHTVVERHKLSLVRQEQVVQPAMNTRNKSTIIRVCSSTWGAWWWSYSRP